MPSQVRILHPAPILMTDTYVTSYPPNLYIDWALKILGRPNAITSVRSGPRSSVFKLASENETWFVKIADNLSAEIERLKWLQSTDLATPKLVAQNIDGSLQAILISGIPGMDLAELSAIQPKQDTVRQLSQALKQFHDTDASKCPFIADISGDKLIHGDACLPNIIYKDNQLSGYVDLSSLGVGSIDVDLSAAIWSLQFNLGAGYGLAFLKDYGHDVITEDEVSRLYSIYENSPIFGS
jgi:aminoglycoside 3'-phosphotransferase-2